MKISTKGRYGLRILMDLALHQSEKPRLIRDIAKSQQISEKYISRLVIALRKGGMIRSVRGVNGGFHLAMKPEDITLLAVIEVMEGPLSIVDCVSAPKRCKLSENCAPREVWCKLNEDIRALMAGTTLADILASYERHNADRGDMDYCI
ncbi:MAG: Rrf2 family transcriptional regulator [Lentisphaeria bacterium]|nr:Rrf2 family transcriptional regulator [Lentisphaeria bacterium]